MKINWGTGIVLAFIGFIGFILYFVFIIITDRKAEHHLVTDEYYQEELAFQKEIDAEENAREFTNQFKYEVSDDGLLITIPEALRNNNTQGVVSLYRPSNKHLDFNLSISLSNTHLLIPDKRLLGGRWDIKIRWNYNDKDYLVRKKITY